MGLAGLPWIWISMDIHGYGYPWISTENLWIWIWIWMWNFISTATLGFGLLPLNIATIHSWPESLGEPLTTVKGSCLGDDWLNCLPDKKLGQLGSLPSGIGWTVKWWRGLHRIIVCVCWKQANGPKTAWTLSTFVPLFKKGGSTDLCADYRTISYITC